MRQITEELQNLNLHDSSILLLKTIIYEQKNEYILDLFLNLLIVFETNHNLKKKLQYDNIHNLIIEYILYFSNTNSIILDNTTTNKLNSMVKKIIMLLNSDILYENLEANRKKLFFKK